MLADRDAERIARSIAGLSEEAAESARALVVSFGTCSVTEPLNELIELGLIAAAAAPDDP